jgi:hypothetical protein
VGGRRKPIIRSLATTATTTGDRDRTPPRGGLLPTPSGLPVLGLRTQRTLPLRGTAPIDDELGARGTDVHAARHRRHAWIRGALKAADFPAADASWQQLIFSNTYHLMLRPGSDIVRDAGGIHEFTGRRNGPFITDSGGFQVFSLKYGGVTESLESGGGELKRASSSRGKRKSYWRSDVMGKVKVTEDHVEFRSYRDGSRVTLSPESSIRAQKDIGADVSICIADLSSPSALHGSCPVS